MKQKKKNQDKQIINTTSLSDINPFYSNITFVSLLVIISYFGTLHEYGIVSEGHHFKELIKFMSATFTCPLQGV